ncbi:unnamed protein product [Aspergillus oryzae]|uniref:Unnamed protein product n=1 Tax=Aspergillus oryzae TaxID=5062 RepID=A0AAN4YJ00_ASPOZ|nr:unnamed protein product [Aspergillus oryzae]GMG31244.1 unnamed protein product [Aspergillus oryzae]
MLQTQTQHVFSHQHQYPADPSWLQHQQQQQQQQQQQHHQAQHHPHQAQQQHSSLVAQQHAQVQAAAAAAAAAQQQHYNRIAMAGNPAAGNPAQGAGAGGLSGDGALPGAVSVMDGGISDENRKVFIWVAELLDPNRREAALMELSKKREQVPELALVIWHSFGMNCFLYVATTSWMLTSWSL